MDSATAAAEYSRQIWSGQTSAVARLRVVMTTTDPRESSIKPTTYKPGAATIATRTKPMIDRLLLACDIRRSFTVGIRRAIANYPVTVGIRNANVNRVTTPQRARKRPA